MNRILSVFLVALFFCKGYGDTVTWDLPGTIVSSALVDSSEPQVAIDVGNQGIVVWVEAGVVTAKTVLGGVWSAPTVLSQSPNSSSPQLVVAVNTGVATAIWVDGATQRIQAARMDAFGVWTVNLTLVSDPGEVAAYPALGIDSLNNVVAVWSGDTGSDIVFTRSSTNAFSAGTWTAQENLGRSVALDLFPAPRVSLNNDVVVAAWHGDVTNQDVISAATKAVAATTWTTTTISNPANKATHPAVAVALSGNARVTWFEFTLSGTIYTDISIQTRTYVGAVWEPQSELKEDVGVSNPNRLVHRLTVNGLGKNMLLWTQTLDDSDYNPISIVQETTNTEWTADAALSAVSPFSVDADVAISSGTDAFGIAMDYDWDNDLMLIKAMHTQLSTPMPGSWQDRQLLSTGTNNLNPKIATALDQGDATNQLTIAAWITYDGANNVINVVTGNGSIPLPPSGFSATRSTITYGGLSQEIITLNWTASPDPQLGGYYILRNNKLIARLSDPLATSYVDENRPCDESGTYGISSLMDDGSQSQIVTTPYFVCP
jgi:hypothetical protein